jgi:NAD(P)-dependent dehydrogenase (short-subunit alcohol dehydrogenase family)
MEERLKGKVALVAGAGCVGPGWGNGRATAVIFAREGARIFAVDRDAEAMRETVARVRDGGGEITTHVCDVTDAEGGRSHGRGVPRRLWQDRYSRQQCRRSAAGGRSS